MEKMPNVTLAYQFEEHMHQKLKEWKMKMHGGHHGTTGRRTGGHHKWGDKRAWMNRMMNRKQGQSGGQSNYNQGMMGNMIKAWMQSESISCFLSSRGTFFLTCHFPVTYLQTCRAVSREVNPNHTPTLTHTHTHTRNQMCSTMASIASSPLTSLKIANHKGAPSSKM